MSINLPALSTLQWAMPLAWSLVLACLGGVVTGRLVPRGHPVRRPLQMAVVCTCAAWTWLPGPASPAYWLGLAFQMPSLLSVWLCAVFLRRSLAEVGVAAVPVPSGFGARSGWLLGGVLIGWALLFDTFAVLPVQLYAWGFSPAAVAVLAFAAMGPWAWTQGGAGNALHPGMWVVPVTILCFVVSRLPTGNVWDAVLDPWLWLVLHILLGKDALNRYQKRSK